MIIGISGKIGSGKDTIGHIIRNLIWFHEDVKDEYEEYEDISFVKHQLDHLRRNDLVPHDDNYTWKIKKFAFKLKQIVSILTGISVEDLEKQEVKNKQLPKEWDYYEILLKTQQELKKQRVVSENMNIIEENDEIRSSYTVRELLQRVGTEAMRETVHPSIWINALFADYKPLDVTNRAWNGTVLDYVNCTFPNWIITDVRFPNEAEAIKERGGIMIRVSRFSTERDDRVNSLAIGLGIIKSPEEHPSETALDDYQFNYVVDNSGNIEELMVKVKQILMLEKII